MSLTDDREAYRSLLSTTCPACGARKQCRQTLYGDCYHAIPTRMRWDLFKHVGHGYLEAVNDAIAWLGQRMPKKSDQLTFNGVQIEYCEKLGDDDE
jgi:hypothetical protein